MELYKVNSLVELFFEKYKEKKEFKNHVVLKWLKTNDKDFLTWEQVKHNICLLSVYLEEHLSSLIHLYLGITIICNIFGWGPFDG